MDIDYEKAYNGLLVLSYTITYSIRRFRYYSDESCKICRDLERAVCEAEEMILRDVIFSYEMYEKAYTFLSAAMDQVMEFAKIHERVEGVGAIYRCLSLISSASVISTYPPEGTREARSGLETVINTILKPLRRDECEGSKLASCNVIPMSMSRNN